MLCDPAQEIFYQTYLLLINNISPFKYTIFYAFIHTFLVFFLEMNILICMFYLSYLLLESLQFKTSVYILNFFSILFYV